MSPDSQQPITGLYNGDVHLMSPDSQQPITGFVPCQPSGEHSRDGGWGGGVFRDGGRGGTGDCLGLSRECLGLSRECLGTLYGHEVGLVPTLQEAVSSPISTEH